MLSNLQGYRTIIVNVVAALVGVASMLGVVVPQDDSTAFTAGLIAFANILMRLKTTTPVGEKPVE